MPCRLFTRYRLIVALKPLRYSYGAVLAAVLVGLVAPGWASWVLGPVLLLGLVGLGVAHGACDQYVVPALHPELAQDRGRYWAGFLGGYLGLAAAVGVLWWWRPELAVACFFGLSAWHWGSGDAPPAARYRGQWLAHSLLRGGLIFAVPLLVWPRQTQQLTSGLLALAGAAPVSTGAVAAAGQVLGPVVLVGHLALWGSYRVLGQRTLAATDALEALLLVALLVVLPPVLSSSVYFVFWHSLRHVLRMNALMGHPTADRPLWENLRFFLKRSAPILTLSVVALAALCGWQWTQAASGSVLISLALLVASVVTLPHALLVTLGLDVARWRQGRGGVPNPSNENY